MLAQITLALWQGNTAQQAAVGRAKMLKEKDKGYQSGSLNAHFSHISHNLVPTTGVISLSPDSLKDRTLDYCYTGNKVFNICTIFKRHTIPKP